MSESEKKKKKPLKGTGGTLAGSSITEDEKDDDEDEISSTKIVSNVVYPCHSCGRKFPSESAWADHIENGKCTG